MQPLPVLVAGASSQAYDINDSGYSVGWSDSTGGQRAVLWTPAGTVQNLGVPSGATTSTAYGINELEQVVGWSNNGHAFLWSTSSGFQDLGVLAGYSQSYAYAINDHGYIVGVNALTGHPFVPSLWTPADGWLDLSSLLDSSGSGWTLSSVQGINNAGQIVGYGDNPSGETRAFVLTPVPEPSTLVLAACGAVGLLLFARRHRRRARIAVRSIATTLCLGLLLLLATSAPAAPITVQFEGTVDFADTDNGFFANTVSAGDTFTGSYTYDSTLADSNATATQGEYRYTTGGAFGMTTTINSMVFQTAADVSGQNRIEIFADDPFNDDRYGIWNSANDPHNGYVVDSQILMLTDASKTANASDALPTVAPDLNLFPTINQFSLVLTDESHMDIDAFYGTITSISLVPEPSTAVLAGLGGLSLLLVALRRRRRALAASLAACVALLASALPASATPVTIDWVPVGNAGNANDPATGNLYGAVAYNYSIDKYDVTVGQYTEFLNSVAATDTYGLYNPSMGTDQNIEGISRSGSSGSYTYSVIGTSANLPITYVNWGDAARFSNWLQNGQPTGAEGPGTTETGAYTLNGATSQAALNAFTRNSDATIFIPSESEWYKAAYYNPAGSYNQYPFSSNTVPTSAPPGSTPDTGNFLSPGGAFAVTGSTSYSSSQSYLTAVGTYTASASPYGVYDMGGNVFQWNEALISGSYRGLRGGSWLDDSLPLQSSNRGGISPTFEYYLFGFRVASVPEPSTAVLAAFALVSLIAWTWRRRRR